MEHQALLFTYQAHGIILLYITHFLMIMYRRALPSVWSSLWRTKVWHVSSSGFAPCICKQTNKNSVIEHFIDNWQKQSCDRQYPWSAGLYLTTIIISSWTWCKLNFSFRSHSIHALHFIVLTQVILYNFTIIVYTVETSITAWPVVLLCREITHSISLILSISVQYLDFAEVYNVLNTVSWLRRSLFV